jgi:hypothetical protein
MVVMALAAVQAALWGHARTEARIVAQETAALVARTTMTPSQAQQLALELLNTQGDLTAVEVTISDDTVSVVVIVSAQAPGMIRGTTAPIEVRAVAASESGV